MGEHDPGPTDATPVIDVAGLRKHYDPSPWWLKMFVRSPLERRVEALAGIDLTVDSGAIAAVVGPNGAGKTTLFRILSGLTTATAGHVRVLGLDPQRDSRAIRRQIGWMPAEDRSLFLRLTCEENLRFHGMLHQLPSPRLDAMIAEALSDVGLGHAAKRAAFSLSAGMRSRLQLARALLHRPRLLLLDEPTGSVDPVAAHDLLELIVRLVDEYGATALISSHRLEEIEALGSRLLLLDGGTILYDGELEELRQRWKRPVVELTFRDPESAQHAARALDRPSGPFAEHAVVGAALRGQLAHGVTVGEVLAQLGGLIAELVSVQELPLPLRDLLREVYRTGRDLVTEPS